jgi:hypothetical protein
MDNDRSLNQSISVATSELSGNSCCSAQLLGNGDATSRYKLKEAQIFPRAFFSARLSYC